MEMSQEVKDLFSALSKAQGEIRVALKDQVNPHFKSKYAGLDSAWEAVREPLSKYGLSVTQLISSDADKIYITTILAHASGQWIRSTTSVCSSSIAPQAAGSAITYYRRYSLLAITGCAPGEEDDDANSAQAAFNKCSTQPSAQNKSKGDTRETDNTDILGKFSHLTKDIPSDQMKDYLDHFYEICKEKCPSREQFNVEWARRWIQNPNGARVTFDKFLADSKQKHKEELVSETEEQEPS